MNHTQRMQRALLSLDGLSVGDAFGQQFFAPGTAALIRPRTTPPPVWPYTDDTAMAISIVRMLEANGRIDQDELASRFASEFTGDPGRGYGAGAIRLLQSVARGTPWKEAAYAMFGGEGSMGNGGAMRIAPIGGYFADDLDHVVDQARLSAEVTHAHRDGQAGAIAVAVAAALAARTGDSADPADSTSMFEAVIDRTPDGLTRTNIRQAAVLPASTSMAVVVHTLGNGSGIVAYDTVAFCLWCAFHHLDSFEDALWTCVTAGGDIDTTSAIVGGIVSLAVGRPGIPRAWIRAREDLPISTGGSTLFRKEREP
ncbi:MAG: crystallin J1 [Phycisphaeraceae bacterium]|nr:crystallin J1 [Phycisphaeraceae bacterium]